MMVSDDCVHARGGLSVCVCEVTRLRERVFGRDCEQSSATLFLRASSSSKASSIRGYKQQCHGNTAVGKDIPFPRLKPVCLMIPGAPKNKCRKLLKTSSSLWWSVGDTKRATRARFLPRFLLTHFLRKKFNGQWLDQFF